MVVRIRAFRLVICDWIRIEPEPRSQPFAFANPTYLDMSLPPLRGEDSFFQSPQSLFQVWIHRALFGFSLRLVLLDRCQARIKLFGLDRVPLTVQHARDCLTLLRAQPAPRHLLQDERQRLH